MTNRDLYKNKYRSASARAQWWNYGWDGAYFITICTQNRKHHFGEIQNGKMILSPMGVLAYILWHEIPHHTQFVALGDLVVMPNHIHGILIIDKPEGMLHATSPQPLQPVRTLHATSQQQQQPKNQKMSDISPKSKTVSSIIRSYKSAVTFHGNRLGLENGWQSRFHDHIIRNDAAYQRISDYIVSNPENWGKDKFH